MKNPSLINKSKFVNCRNKFKSLRIQAEKLYYSKEFLKNHGDLKSTWKLIRSALQTESGSKKINQLIIDGAMIEDPEIMANEFNNYFTKIPGDLAKNLPTSSCTHDVYLPPPNVSSLGILLTSPEEIINIGKTIEKNSYKGTGWN